MKNPHHRELEVKIAADKVDVDAFNRWCFSQGPAKFLKVEGPDVYYTQGQNVIRHRQGGGSNELTVKRRTSRTSTKDRLEIDLKLAAGTSTEDATQFLLATGWERHLSLVKIASIFWFEEKEPRVEAVIYDVMAVDDNGERTPSRRFVEFEISKADSNHPLALATLRAWEKRARVAFNLGETMTQSLYEIYSGKRYGMVRR